MAQIFMYNLVVIKKDLLFIFTTIFAATLAVIGLRDLMSYFQTPAKVHAMNKNVCEKSGGMWAPVKEPGEDTKTIWSYKCKCPTKDTSLWISEGVKDSCRNL